MQALVIKRQIINRQAGFADYLPGDIGTAMNEFGAELNRNFQLRIPMCENSPPIRSRASRIRTLHPPSDKTFAAASPAAPAPRMIAPIFTIQLHQTNYIKARPAGSYK